jgi:hypothetical protein
MRTMQQQTRENVNRLFISPSIRLYTGLSKEGSLTERPIPNQPKFIVRTSSITSEILAQKFYSLLLLFAGELSKMFSSMSGLSRVNMWCVLVYVAVPDLGVCPCILGSTALYTFYHTACPKQK